MSLPSKSRVTINVKFLKVLQSVPYQIHQSKLCGCYAMASRDFIVLYPSLRDEPTNVWNSRMHLWNKETQLKLFYVCSGRQKELQKGAFSFYSPFCETFIAFLEISTALSVCLKKKKKRTVHHKSKFAKSISCLNMLSYKGGGQRVYKKSIVLP